MEEDLNRILKKLKNKMKRSMENGQNGMTLGVEVNSKTGAMRIMDEDDEEDGIDEELMEKMLGLSPEEMVKEINEQDDEFRSKQKIEKSFPAQADWIARQKDLQQKGLDMLKLMNKSRALSQKADKERKKAKVLRDGLWAEIRAKLEVYEGHLHWNEKTEEVELYEDADKKPKPKAVKSPFQKL